MRYGDGGGAGRALAIGLIVVAATVGGLGWFIYSLADSDNLKPKLIAAVRQATGRTLTISGSVGVKFSAVPTLILNDVALSNPPGFSRPEMMKIARVELSVALAPLLERRLELGRVTLVRPDILIESKSGGQGNWVVQRDAASSGGMDAGGAAIGGTASGGTSGASLPAPAGPRGDGYAVSIEDLRVVDGHVAYLDDATGRAVVAIVPALTLNAPAAAPMTATGTAILGGVETSFDLKTGAANQLRTASEAEPWAVRFHATSARASAVVAGRIAHPLEGRGYDIGIDADIPDPTLLAPLFPGVPLTAMQQIAAHADVADGGTGQVAIPLLRLAIGSVDLAGLAIGTLDGLPAASRLESVTLTARGGAPMQISARVALAGVDAGLSGTAGDLTWLAKGAAGPVDLVLEANVSSARAVLKGRIEAPLRRQGYAFDLNLMVPNPSLLFDAAPRDLKAFELRTQVTDAPGMVPFQISSSAGDLSGDMEISLHPRLTIAGRAVSKRLNVDVLRSPPRAAPVAAARAGTQAQGSGATGAKPEGGAATGTQPTGTQPAGPQAAGTQPAGATVPAKAAPVFSAAPLPFGLLTRFDADLSLRVGAMRAGGAEMTGIDVALKAKDGRARLDPISVSTPSGKQEGTLEIDAASTPPRLHLTLSAPAVAVRPMFAMAGLPPALSGAAEMRADLTATGESPKDIAASLTGWAGIAMENGQLDAKTVNGWLDRLRPLKIEGGDTTELRCFALRLDAKDGIATMQPTAFNTAALIADGGGEIDLRHETLALRLRPRTRIGGTGVAVPLRIAGSFGAPAARLDMAANGGGAMAGLLLGGKDIMGAGGGGDPCPLALARARDEAAPAGSAAPPPAGPPRGTAVPATDVLRLLLGRPEGKK